MTKKGCPAMFLLSNGTTIERPISIESANAYLSGTPCEILGTVMLLPERKEVIVDDLLIKVVLSPAYRVHTN